MVLGMRIIDLGLETVVESEGSEPEGDPVDVFREFVTDDCFLEVLLYLPEDQLPPCCAYPADVETVPGKRAYRVISDGAETFRWPRTDAPGADPPIAGERRRGRAGSAYPSSRTASGQPT